MEEVSEAGCQNRGSQSRDRVEQLPRCEKAALEHGCSYEALVIREKAVLEHGYSYEALVIRERATLEYEVFMQQ